MSPPCLIRRQSIRSEAAKKHQRHQQDDKTLCHKSLLLRVLAHTVNVDDTTIANSVAVAEERVRVNQYGQRNVWETADAIGRGGGVFKLRLFSAAYAAGSYRHFQIPNFHQMGWVLKSFFLGSCGILDMACGLADLRSF
ncbi:hypothetical protein B0H14DRAFT_2619948 [Mycena olivaceomarginata]|nr:hypothetical protein B0H14DRAFT_2619948 [Mycena olivaceomarginata]